MKKKKNNNSKFIAIIAILIVTIMIQLFYNIIRNNILRKKSNSQNENNSSVTLPYEILIKNFDEALSNYNGTVSKNKIRESISDLVVETISFIGNETRNKTISENEDFFNREEMSISNMGIRSKEEFLLIAEEINNASIDNSLIFNNAELSKEDNSDVSDGYYKMNLTLNYNNKKMIKLKCYVSIKNNTIMYLSNSQISQLYSIYSGNVEKIELIRTIYNFIDNIEWIRDNTKLVSINKQYQFYSDNKEKFKQMGIYTRDDFISVSMAMSNDVAWNDNTKLNYYTIDFTNYDKNENDYIFNITFIFDYIKQLKLKVNLYNADNNDSYVKIYGSSIE